MKYYAVIDTNVFVSALLKWTSIPGKVAAQVLIGNITPLLNEAIIAEYKEVLGRKKFDFPKEAVKVFLHGVMKRSMFVDVTDGEYDLPDPKDTVFYAVVTEARKKQESYLVTGNVKHFPIKPFVVTPKQMLEIMEQ